MKKIFGIILKEECASEHEIYYKMIAVHNVVKEWGLTPTQINILVYLMRLGYSDTTKNIICKKLKISKPSLSTNLSYLRTGKVGNKRIAKLIKTSDKNMNITVLTPELKDIQKIIQLKKTNIVIRLEDVVTQ